MFEDIFKWKKCNIEKMSAYGFVRKDGKWVYETNIMDKGKNPSSRFLNRIKPALFRFGTKTLFHFLIGRTQCNEVCRFNILENRTLSYIILRIQTAGKHQIPSVSPAYSFF